MNQYIQPLATIGPPFELFGLKVHIHKGFPRYVLPRELIPGLPWPKGFLEEFGKWSASTLGFVPALETGQYYFMKGTNAVIMDETTYKLLTMALKPPVNLTRETK